jgi:hypothetical protein
MDRAKAAEALKALGIRPTAEILAERRTAARPAKSKPVPKGKKPRKPFPIILEPAQSHGSGAWEVTLQDWIPTSLSTLMHINHWKAGKIKHDEAMLIATAFRKAGATGAIGKRFLTMTLILTPRMRERDQDNVWKGVKDGLKRCGAVVDDSPKWLDHDKPQYERAETKATRLRLEDVPGPIKVEPKPKKGIKHGPL